MTEVCGRRFLEQRSSAGRVAVAIQYSMRMQRFVCKVCTSLIYKGNCACPSASTRRQDIAAAEPNHVRIVAGLAGKLKPQRWTWISIFMATACGGLVMEVLHGGKRQAATHQAAPALLNFALESP